MAAGLKSFFDLLNGRTATAVARMLIFASPVLVPVCLYASRSWLNDTIRVAPAVSELRESYTSVSSQATNNTERIRTLEEAKRAIETGINNLTNLATKQAEQIQRQADQNQRIEAQLNRLIGAFEASGALRPSPTVSFVPKPAPQTQTN